MSNVTSANPDTSTSPEPTPSTSTEPSSSSVTSNPPSSSTSSSNPPPPPPTTTTSSSSSAPPPSSTQPPPNTSTTPPPDSTSPPDQPQSTSTTILTETLPPTSPTSGTLPPPSSTSGGAAINPSDGASAGLSNSARIAIGVVVPIAAVALLVLAGIFLWRKRKQRKDAEEQRRKEVEDYGYNPNADPTIPAVAGASYEMSQDGSSGYRGWGSTTLAGSTGRKASTTMSGGAAAYSDAPSPTRAAVSDTRSGEPLMGETPPSPEGEILGVLGPSAASNRVDVHRGPSNASSSYSAAGRSDGSGDGPIGVAYGGPNQYYQQYDQYGSGNPYTDGGHSGRPEGVAPPVIRDVTARRNTRIENPAHYPQQTAGISQNF
ncbi:hypothetical protein MFIFM68171_03530 [Madurella fahalii]|uniref:Uncharacterized protein n=1 Tax=Madurella fahalii TaxID=1157608 RepID=A0ABQ0G6W7_9PEZI